MTGTVGFVMQVLVVLDLSQSGIRSVFCSNGICILECHTFGFFWPAYLDKLHLWDFPDWKSSNETTLWSFLAVCSFQPLRDNVHKCSYSSTQHIVCRTCIFLTVSSFDRVTTCGTELVSLETHHMLLGPGASTTLFSCISRAAFVSSWQVGLNRGQRWFGRTCWRAPRQLEH